MSPHVLTLQGCIKPMSMSRLLVTLIMVFAILAIPSKSSAQAVELKNQATALASAVVPAESGSRKYEQAITFTEPALIRYSYTETDQKGASTQYAYEFNLADIDPYAVRQQTQKDLISVAIMARNKQKLIKVYKNGAVEPYDAQTAIIAKDIDNARAIVEVVKKAIPLAENIMAARLKLSGYDQMVSWLTANVKDVSFGEKNIQQSMAQGEHPGTLVLTRVETDSKGATEEVFTFNLADVNTNAVVYKITGNQFAIQLGTLQKAKYIAAKRNNAIRPYAADLVILTGNPDEARDLKHVLSTVVPLAIEKVKSAMPTVKSETEGIQKMTSLVTDISYGEKQTLQKFEGVCLGTLTQVDKDPKSSKKNEFKFNWMDVHSPASKIEVSGDRIYIDLHFADDKKVVMQTADDGFKGYNNNVKIYMPDIESARRASFIVNQVVEKCKTAYKKPFGNDAASTIAYFTGNVRELTLDEVTLKQTVEAVDGDNNKFKYTVIQVNAKGSGSEQVHEFNLSDINPLSIAIEVKGKWMYVVVETDFKGKIIKSYKDGKIQPYSSTLAFAVNDVEVARNLVSALNTAVKARKTK